MDSLLSASHWLGLNGKGSFRFELQKLPSTPVTVEVAVWRSDLQKSRKNVEKYILSFRCPPLSTSHWLESWVFYDVDHWEESQLKDSHQGPGNSEQFNGCEIYLTLLVKSRTQKLFSLLTCTVGGNPFWKIAIRAGTGQTCQRIQLFLVLHENWQKHKHNSNMRRH